jgi:DNA-binding response OmpR family regulator
MKALIIDDNQDISELLSIYLKSKGYDTVVINDSKIALDHIKEENYDVTVLDISMPELSGIDIIRKLERKDILKDNKIVILSAVDFTPLQINNLLKKEGIHNCLKKPIQLKELLTAVTS